MIAVTDEIYEHIIYDGRPHVALAGLDGMWERSVTIGGMSKTYAVTGWRVGTILAPPRLTHAFRQVHDFVSIGAAAPLQEAGAVAYRLPRPYYDRLAADYQARRDRFCGVLTEVGFELEPPEGAYYVMAGIGAFGATDDVDFAALPGPRHRRRHGAGLELLPRQSPGPTLRPLLLLQAGRDARPGRRAAAEAAGDRLRSAEESREARAAWRRVLLEHRGAARPPRWLIEQLASLLWPQRTFSGWPLGHMKTIRLQIRSDWLPT